MLINVYMPTIVGIWTFKSRINLFSAELSMNKKPRGSTRFDCVTRTGQALNVCFTLKHKAAFVFLNQSTQALNRSNIA